MTERMVSLGEAMDSAIEKLTSGSLPPPGDPPPAPPTEQDPDDALREALRRAGVPDRYLDCSLDTFEAVPGVGRIVEKARAIVERPSGLLLVGKPGSGKTHIAVGILRGLALRRRSVDPRYAHFRSRFVVVPEFLDNLRERIGDASVTDPLPELKTCPMLVLDDLGREKPTEWVTDRLYVLINHRYNRMLPTIATTNYPLSELADRGYDAMISRLRESAVTVQLSAADYRRAA